MDLQNKVITITKVEITDERYKIYDQDNNWYAFYAHKKDGQESVAFKQWKDMELGKNMIVNVSYNEEQKEYNGKSFTDRRVATFREAGSQAPVLQQSTPKSQNNAPSKESDEFWDKKAYKQCLWGMWLASQSSLGLDWKDRVWEVFKEIEQDADKRFAKGMDKARAIFVDEVPTIQQDEDINVDDIPW